MRFTLLKQSFLAKTGPQVGFRIDFIGAAALILATVAYQHIPQSQSTLLGRYGSSAIPLPPPPPPATSATKHAPSRTAPFGSSQSDSELPHAHYIPLAGVAGGLLAGAGMSAARAFASNISPRSNSMELTTGLEDIPPKLNRSIQNASAQLFNVTTEFVLDLVLAPIAYPAVALAWRTFDVCQSQPWWTLASDQSSKVVELAPVTVVTQKMVALPVVLNHCWTLAGGLLVSALVGAWVIWQRRGCQSRPVIMTPVEPGDETTMEDNVALVHLEEEDLQSFKTPRTPGAGRRNHSWHVPYPWQWR
ncbi:hypothetical protein FPV67DRAFT_1479818, partial [Lyophyllum atratum]